MLSAPEGTLIFTWGNPSRGDDAIGPQVYDMLCSRNLVGVDMLTDFQLQIEHAVDLEKRERVLFVDASISTKPPYTLSRLWPDMDSSYTTHAMSPGALLAVFEQINHRQPPASFLLTIKGYDFGLGLPLSKRALGNTAEAVDLIVGLVKTEGTDAWLEKCAGRPHGM